MTPANTNITQDQRQPRAESIDLYQGSTPYDDIQLRPKSNETASLMDQLEEPRMIFNVRSDFYSDQWIIHIHNKLNSS